MQRRSTQILTPSLITASSEAVGVALVIPILVGMPHGVGVGVRTKPVPLLLLPLLAKEGRGGTNCFGEREKKVREARPPLLHRVGWWGGGKKV